MSDFEGEEKEWSESVRCAERRGEAYGSGLDV